MLCLDVEDKGTLRWVLAQGSGATYLRAGEPLARAAPVLPGATRLLLSIATPALKAARPPLREGAETERGEEGDVEVAGQTRGK